MAGEVIGSALEGFSLWRARRRAPGHFSLTIVGSMLWMGLAGFVCAADVAPATSQKQGGLDDKGGTKGAVDQGSLQAEETLIYPDDLLFIQVFDVPEMTRDYRVSAAGTLLFPLLTEPVRAEGLTPQQLAALVSKKCVEAGVLSHPQINVTVHESRVHSVAITGAVRNPQIYPVFGRISLLDIISQAGGVADDAGFTVTITRGEVYLRMLASERGATGDEGKSVLVPSTESIDLKSLLETGDPTLNVAVYPGDRVTVQRAGVVYVLGAVTRAGGFLLTSARGDLTVLKAVALAEYLKPTAKGKKALILRPNSTAPGGREEIPIDLNAMLQGRAPDKPLQSNDIVFVPDSIALKALHRAGDVAVTAAGYAAIYR